MLERRLLGGEGGPELLETLLAVLEVTAGLGEGLALAGRIGAERLAAPPQGPGWSPRCV